MSQTLMPKRDQPRFHINVRNQITKNIGTKTQPDSAFQLSVATIEEQGILESFSRLPQAEREIVRQLLEKFGPQQVGVIRLPVPFGPKKVKERRNFLLLVYKLIRYHRLIFDSVADGVFHSTYLPWIDSITHAKAGEKEEIDLRLNSNYENVWRVLNTWWLVREKGSTFATTDCVGLITA